MQHNNKRADCIYVLKLHVYEIMHVETRANWFKNVGEQNMQKNKNQGQTEFTYKITCLCDNASDVHVQTRVFTSKSKEGKHTIANQKTKGQYV